MYYKVEVNCMYIDVHVCVLQFHSSVAYFARVISSKLSRVSLEFTVSPPSGSGGKGLPGLSAMIGIQGVLTVGLN